MVYVHDYIKGTTKNVKPAERQWIELSKKLKQKFSNSVRRQHKNDILKWDKSLLL